MSYSNVSERKSAWKKKTVVWLRLYDCYTPQLKNHGSNEKGALDSKFDNINHLIITEKKMELFAFNVYEKSVELVFAVGATY